MLIPSKKAYTDNIGIKQTVYTKRIKYEYIGLSEFLVNNRANPNNKNSIIEINHLFESNL